MGSPGPAGHAATRKLLPGRGLYRCDFAAPEGRRKCGGLFRVLPLPKGRSGSLAAIQQITVLFDGDPAGLKASLRGIDMILAAGLHVRVVVFPEGEDPDSYSQKLGSTAFQEYLAENAQDFLTFKASLFAKEAANDPIKKAETVKEVVASIAKIPDPIERAVYLKECGTVLGMDEELLIKELNKLQQQNLQKEAGGRQSGGRQSGGRQSGARQSSGAKPSAGAQDDDAYYYEGPPSDYYEPFDEMPAERPKALSETQVLEQSLRLQEKESIRLLLNYGFNEIEEAFHLYDYLLQEIDELEFQTPIYKTILLTFKEKLAQGQVLDAQYFIREGSAEIKEEVANLIVEKYDLSKVWEERHNIYVPREDQLLEKAVFQNVVRLKYRTLEKLIQENLARLKTAKDQVEQEEIMQTHMSLKSSTKELSDFLGMVVAK